MRTTRAAPNGRRTQHGRVLSPREAPDVATSTVGRGRSARQQRSQGQTRRGRTGPFPGSRSAHGREPARTRTDGRTDDLAGDGRSRGARVTKGNVQSWKRLQRR